MPTAQKRQPLVHSCPAIMKVASPLDQHSWMLGHFASSQTVCNLLSLTDALVSLNILCCLPVGSLVLNHGGKRLFGLLAGLSLAIGKCLEAIEFPRITSQRILL